MIFVLIFGNMLYNKISYGNLIRFYLSIIWLLFGTLYFVLNICLMLLNYLSKNKDFIKNLKVIRNKFNEGFEHISELILLKLKDILEQYGIMKFIEIINNVFSKIEKSIKGYGYYGIFLMVVRPVIVDIYDHYYKEEEEEEEEEIKNNKDKSINNVSDKINKEVYSKMFDNVLNDIPNILNRLNKK
jgi:hypothetical protein